MPERISISEPPMPPWCAVYSQRMCSRTKVLLSQGIAVMRRSIIRRSRSISSSSARRSR